MPSDSPAGSVRPARVADVAAIGAVQSAAWRAAYADLLPTELLAEVTAPALAEQWQRAIRSAPSRRHRVLVACGGTDVVGFAAFAPSEDADLDPEVDAEVHALVVAPDATRSGHGSRLLHAAADLLHAEGFARAHLWLVEGDSALGDFLVGAGWDRDGAERALDLRGDGEVVVTQHRLHTELVDPAPGST